MQKQKQINWISSNSWVSVVFVHCTDLWEFSFWIQIGLELKPVQRTCRVNDLKHTYFHMKFSIRSLSPLIFIRRVLIFRDFVWILSFFVGRNFLDFSSKFPSNLPIKNNETKEEKKQIIRRTLDAECYPRFESDKIKYTHRRQNIFRSLYLSINECVCVCVLWMFKILRR